MLTLLNCLRENLPAGFEEGISYGMITFSVPLSTYPKGYHATPGQPLPFISLASQKGHIALYHFGIYMSAPMLNGLRPNTLSILPPASIWAKAASASNSPARFPSP